MLQNHATLQEIRLFLVSEARGIYSEGEAASLATIIMDHLGFGRSRALAEPDQVPGQAIVAQINDIVEELHRGAPVQYILGYSYFCDMKVELNNNVLIPRPETEEMILRIIDEQERAPLRIIDLGTGSGCMALALKQSFPGAQVFGMDKNLAAIELARKNGDINRLDVNWMPGDLLDPEFPDRDPEHAYGGPFDLVVSNPPYVTKSEGRFMESHVLDFEPHDALFVEDDNPLLFYHPIILFAKKNLKPGGWLWMEINERFGREVDCLCNTSGFTETKRYLDIHGKQRFIKAGIQ
jgi:release factor glutamine methyltransferase